MLLVGCDEEHQACKKLSDKMLDWLFCLVQSATDLYMVQIMPLPTHHVIALLKSKMFYFLVPAYSAGKEVAKCVCLLSFKVFVFS